MDGYTQLIKGISVGTSDCGYPTLSDEQLQSLLKQVVEKTKATAGPNNTWQSSKYFIYIGTFPKPHIGVDNKAGTSRLYTITSEQDIKKIK